MQLWADMNTKVHRFGQECLQDKSISRYILWHGEDSFGLRGKEHQEELINSISGRITNMLESILADK
jgi:hypothetical protein